MNASWSLQKAVYGALAAHEAVKSVVGDPPRVYDAPPPGAALPYIVIGEDRVAAWDTATERGSEHALAIHVWSRGGGRREAKEVIEAVQVALHDAALAPEGHTLVALRFTGSETLRERDGETWHGVIRFRAVMELA